MGIFILVRQLVLLVCINSPLIMSPPARTINKTPLNFLQHSFLIDRLYCQSDPQGASSEVLGLWSQPAAFSTGRSVKMVPQNLHVQNHDDFSVRVQLGLNQFFHFFFSGRLA